MTQPNPPEFPTVPDGRMFIKFVGIKQDEQMLGADPYAVATLHAWVATASLGPTRVTISVKHPAGAAGEPPLEVGPMEGYAGPLHRVAFTSAVTDYYRGAVGSGGSAIKATGQFFMRNNWLGATKGVDIPLPSGPAGGRGGW